MTVSDTHDPILQSQDETGRRWSSDLGNRAVITSISLSCVQFLSVAPTSAPPIIPNLCPTCLKECVFDGQSRVGCIEFSPRRGLIQPAKVRKLNSADGETLSAASCCRLPLLPTNSHVWTGTHTHIHTRSDVCEIWKAYSRETHLISVSVITIIIGTPLHRVRGWRTGIE